jgi:hypothetical protein
VDFMKLDATEVTFYKHIGRQRPYNGKILSTVHNVDVTNLSRIVHVFMSILSYTIAHRAVNVDRLHKMLKVLPGQISSESSPIPLDRPR